MEPMISPWFDLHESNEVMVSPAPPSSVVDSLLDAALEVPTIPKKKGFPLRPRPSSQTTH
jgi:hypothetical protein